MLVPVILSGGAGTRLWPLSRELLSEAAAAAGRGPRTMLQDTVQRARRAAGPRRRWSSATRRTASWSPSSCARSAASPRRSCSSRRAAIPRRPSRLRRTRRCGGCRRRAAAGAARRPCDPRRRGVPCRRRAARGRGRGGAAGHLRHRARQRRKPATATSSAAPSQAAAVCPHRALRREARCATRAAQFVASGDYYWNSGMFLFRARPLPRGAGRAMRPTSPPPAARPSPARRATSTSSALDEAAFEACRSDSIDYAVMEKTADAVVVPLDAGWSDVGSWSALHDAGRPRTRDGNVLRGDVMARGHRGCYVYSRAAGWSRPSA